MLYYPYIESLVGLMTALTEEDFSYKNAKMYFDEVRGFLDKKIPFEENEQIKISKIVTHILHTTYKGSGVTK